jgi:uncharacterized DUF497 family protein
MPPRRKLVSFRGPLPESFLGVTWDEANRQAHEARRPRPGSATTLWLDWSRVMKRRDAEHRGRPDRFRALVGRQLGVQTAVYFVVCRKVNLYLHVISIRYANSDEREIFFRG